MLQELIVYLIIILAVTYTVNQIYFFFKDQSESGCNCSGCDIKKDLTNIKTLIEK
ncbi:MAG: FeoB-associated Cys-rich membrane protein [Bacteroidota bacterium]